MILPLDHLIFGNGHGMKSPYFDNRFYWLSGELYTWIGGLGAQLRSIQWRHPKPGEVRHLCRRSEEHTSELQSLMRISYAVFCLKKKKTKTSPAPKHHPNITTKIT